MNGVRALVHLGWSVVALLGFSAGAQSTNGAAGTNPPPVARVSAPQKLDESAFRIIGERNVFDANRSGGRVAVSNTRRPARIETFTLVGTMAYAKGAFAFFEGSSSEFSKVLKAGGVIAGHKLADILANGVLLEADGRQFELSVGSQMRREDTGPWLVAEVRSGGSNGSGDSALARNGDSSSRTDRSSRGDPSGRSVRSSRSESSPNPVQADQREADKQERKEAKKESKLDSKTESEILKRLMERREKE